MKLMITAKSQYLHKLRKCFPTFGSCEKLYLIHFKKFLEDYLIDFPESTYGDLIREFGTPEEFIDDYFRLIKRDFHKKKTLLRHKLLNPFTFLFLY